jgi:hypothetical protein
VYKNSAQTLVIIRKEFQITERYFDKYVIRNTEFLISSLAKEFNDIQFEIRKLVTNFSLKAYEFKANNAFSNRSTNRIHRLLSSYATEFIRDNKSINRGEKLHWRFRFK